MLSWWALPRSAQLEFRPQPWPRKRRAPPSSAFPQSPSIAVSTAAISTGAVFMGANTYIGNAPNFMVFAIARSMNVRMPGFFGYMLWSGSVLIPIFVLATFVFF